jgi:hypothetical protein
MKLEDWGQELKVLVDECSTHEEKTIYARIPDEQGQADAAAAWAKIDQVYGRGTMERFHGRPKEGVYQRLLQDRRVTNLLTPKDGQTYNAILVEEGQIKVDQATSLLGGFSQMKTRSRRTVKKWAKSFLRRSSRSEKGEQGGARGRRKEQGRRR